MKANTQNSLQMNAYHLCWFLFAWCMPFFMFGQEISFEAKVSKSTLGVNERLRVDFTMNADGDHFQAPTFEGFKVISGPFQQVSQVWENGKMSFSKSYTYVLIPERQGKLTIKQASIEIKGQQYKTSPITINVTEAVQAPRDPNDNSTPSEQAIHLVAEVSKTNPYVNEPITVIYKLYVSYDVMVHQWRDLNKPKYNNFWSQNIDVKNLVVEDGTYNGQKYRFVVLRKTVLYPQKGGNLEIEPLSLDVDMEVPTRRRDFFGRPLMARESRRVSTGARTISVKELPEQGKPVDFSGAVGKFDFKVTASRNTLRAGESFDLEVVASGNGNLKLIDLPKLVAPNAFEVYDPIKSDKITTTLSGMSGSLSEKYTIIPQMKGDFKIKPMSFSYFDLNSKSYKTINSNEILIQVLDGPTGAVANTSANTPVKQTVQVADQFKFIHLKTSLSPITRTAFFGSTRFYVWLTLPLVCIPLAFIIRRKKRDWDADLDGQRIRQSSRLVRKYLGEASKLIGQKEAFYVALEKALHNFMKAKIGMETSEMLKENISELLSQRGADQPTILSFIQLLSDCEAARYAPSSNAEMQKDYDLASQLLPLLEKQLR